MEEKTAFNTDANELEFEISIKSYNGMVIMNITTPEGKKEPPYFEVVGAMHTQMMSMLFRQHSKNMENWLTNKKALETTVSAEVERRLEIEKDKLKTT